MVAIAYSDESVPFHSDRSLLRVPFLALAGAPYFELLISVCVSLGAGTQI